MKKNYLLLVFIGLSLFSKAQVTIAVQDFETSPATPTLTYSANDNGTSPGASTGISTGNSGSTAAPSNSNLFVSGSRGYRMQGPASGSATTSRTLTFANLNTLGYSNIQVSFRVAGMSIGSSGNGMENTIDEVLIEVSPDGGTTWYQQAKVNVSGSGSNARWGFSGTGTGSRSYAANNTFSSFSVNNTNSSGATITGSSAITTATVTGLPCISNLGVRITMQCNSSNESWIIDDVTVTGTQVYYRSKQSGNWATAGNWESSTDLSNWPTATIAPDQSAADIEIQNGHTMAIAADQSVVNTYILNGGVINVNPGINLTILDAAGTDLTVASGGKLVFKSNATGTARLANLGSATITTNANVTVERYIPARRAWRLLSCPMSTTSAPTIFNAWQENTTSTTSTGYGVYITDPGYTVSNSYDAVSSGPSLRYWDGTSLLSPANTNVTKVTDNGAAYFLFVRGDRSITGAGTAVNTTLRMTGNLNTGNVTAGVAGTAYTLIPNPYPSPIDFEQINAAYTQLNTFYVWDATLGSFGAYRTVERTGAAAYQQTPSGGSTTTDNTARYINSGQAFFIPGTGQANGAGALNLTESMKASSVPANNPFKVTNAIEELQINLSTVTSTNTILSDGIRVKFDNAYTATVTSEDIQKLSNFNENLGVNRDNQALAIERRPSVTAEDTIFLKLWNTGVKNYQFDFTPANITPGIDAYLVDAYAGTTNAINMMSSSSYAFSVTTDAASKAEDRFMIIMKKNNTTNGISLINNANDIHVFPNPVTGKELHIQMNKAESGSYVICLFNVAGQVVIKQVVNYNGISPVVLSTNTLVSGAYQLEVVHEGQTKKYTQQVIIK